MRLLVTGGAGFIGSNFVHYWLERHPDDHIAVLDLLTYAGDRRSLADVEERIVFAEGDICDLELCQRLLEDVEVVVNFAAESHNSLAVVDPSRFFRTNVLGTQSLLEAARRTGVSRFHHVSTCEVYGDLPLDSDDVFTEESPYRPRTPYNASKAGADHARRYLLDSSKLRRELGWKPDIAFEDGMQETVDWYAARRNWWEPLKQRALVQETAWR